MSGFLHAGMGGLLHCCVMVIDRSPLERLLALRPMWWRGCGLGMKICPSEEHNGFSMQNAWGVFRAVHENVVHQSQKPHRSRFVHQLAYGISGFDFVNDEATWINGKVRSDTYFNRCVYQHLRHNYNSSR